ncbi:hypothetical protein SDC9_169911 [bioreactor metagenome]|uniref:NAD-specific glutamate dehydrogenase n=1 Tax=bioreactor metagenome TaxID=1076179 RepID=A0A645G6M5_9ZZZZ
MFAIGGVAHAAVHGVAQRTGNGRRCRERQHQGNLVLFEVVVEHLVSHAGLDQGRAQFGVHVDDLVHLAQIQHHLAALTRCGRAVAEVAAGGDGPHRHLVRVADLDDLLHLLHGGGSHHGGRRVLFGGHSHHHLGVGTNQLVLDHHIVFAQDFLELGDGRIEAALAHALGQGHVFACHALLSLFLRLRS